MSWFNIIKKLSGNQSKIDANKDGKITGEDFKQLRESGDDIENVAPLVGAVARRAASKISSKNKEEK